MEWLQMGNCNAIAGFKWFGCGSFGRRPRITSLPADAVFHLQFKLVLDRSLSVSIKFCVMTLLFLRQMELPVGLEIATGA